jgi:Holliday junction resolvase
MQRGKAFEYRIVRLAENNGLNAYRVPLSGGAREKGDVVIAGGMRFECKYRSKGLAFLYRVLEEAERDGCVGVFLSAYRKEALVVLPAAQFFALLRGKSVEHAGTPEVLQKN